jgi:hypothetical protein
LFKTIRFLLIGIAIFFGICILSAIIINTITLKERQRKIIEIINKIDNI